MQNTDKDSPNVPLKPADFQVLLALLPGEMHGYGIMKAVEEQSGGSVKLEVGSMYRLLGRMISQGLIAEAEGPADEAPPSGRRRYFKIAKAGIEAARCEAQRLEGVVKTARANRLLKGTESADA